MAERIDIIVSAKGGASALSQGGGQGMPGIPGGSTLPAVGKGAQEAAGGIEGLAKGVLNLQSAFAGLAVVQVGQQLIGMGVDAGRAALELEKAENTARLLSGTTAQYNDLVDLARKNQVLFGGSLTENIQGLTGFANMARKSGIELSTFNDLASRLNLLSPEQGMEGASIALKEALSGDTQSLVERFELPRQALAGLRDASLDAAGRVALLNKILEEQGVAAGAAASSVSDTAKAYNLLGAGLDAAKTGAGNMVAQGFAPTARGAGLVAQGVADLIGQLQGAPSAFQQAQQGLAANASTYDEYVNAAGRAIDAGRAQTQEIANRFGPLSGMVGLIFEAASSNEVLSRAEWEAARAAQEQGKATQQAATQAAHAASYLTDEQRKQMAAQDASATSARKLEQAQIAIATIGGQVRAGAITAAQGVALLGHDFGFAADEAARLLRNAAAATGAASVSEGRSERTTGAKDANDVRVALAQKEADADAARSRQRLATGSATQVIAERQRLLNEVVRQYGKDSSQAIDAATALQQAQTSAAKSGASEAENAAKKEQQERERRAQEIARAYQQIEDRTADHYRQMERAQEDYALRSSRDEEDFQRQKQRLLAEGRIKEAQLAEEEFRIKQRRGREDQARERERGGQDFALQNALTLRDAGLGGDLPRAAQVKADTRQADTLRAQARKARAAGKGDEAARLDAEAEAAVQRAEEDARRTNTRAAQDMATTDARSSRGEPGAPALAGKPKPGAASAPEAPVLAPSAGALLRMQFSLIVNLDGKQAATALYPYIDQMLAADVVTKTLTAPPAPGGLGQGTGVGGPRP